MRVLEKKCLSFEHFFIYLKNMEIKLCVNIQDDELSRGLLPMLKLMPKIENCKDEVAELVFEGREFFTPLFVLSFIVFCSKCGKKIRLCNLPGYLQTIKFQDLGLHPDQLRTSEFIAMMQKYLNKTYIPIINFPSKSDSRDSIISTVEQMIINQSSIPNNISQALRYIIAESLDNIADHSESQRGYVLAQVYKQKGYLDLCIADSGITLLGSYQKLKNNGITSDIEAMQAAQKRISSKNVNGTDSRGFGIYTSRRMLVDGMGGQYLMISGNAVYMLGKGYDDYYSFPSGIRWGGTIIAFRFPLSKPDFNYANFFE